LKYYDFEEDAVFDVNIPPSGGTVPTVNPENDTIAFLNPEMGLMLTSLPVEARDEEFTPRVINDDLSINVPASSPDGSRLTYMVSQPPAWQIVVSTWDGTNPTLLTTRDPLDFKHPNNVAPTWSPDGETILFLSDRNGRWEFFAVNVDGSNLRQVLKNVTDQISIKYNFSAERVASWME